MKNLSFYKSLLRDTYYTLNGWRFNDLKEHINIGFSKLSSDELAVIELNHVYSSISSNLSKCQKKLLAWVSVMPPHDTGIAIFTYNHLKEALFDCDVFSYVHDIDYFFENKIKLQRLTKNKVQFHSIPALNPFHILYDYQNIVFVLGNSNHNIPIYRHLEKFTRQFLASKVVVYIHDPCIHNLVQESKRCSTKQYFHWLEKLYEQNLQFSEEYNSSPWLGHDYLISKNIFGLKAIEDMGVKSFIVNSIAAQKHIERELSSNVQIQTLFHPVFSPKLSKDLIHKAGVQKAQKDFKLIGTFGYPSENKATGLIIDSVKELIKQGRKYKLLISGYNAKNYCWKYFADNTPDWVLVSETATQYEFEEQMIQCDLAIQLRKKNLGESSGVIPNLLSLNIPVIANRVGAFSEYNDAVFYIDELSRDKLIDEISKRIDAKSYENSCNYIHQHSVHEFNKSLEKILELNN